MEQVKAIFTNKIFWLGAGLGFALGAMHHYFAL